MITRKMMKAAARKGDQYLGFHWTLAADGVRAYRNTPQGTVPVARWHNALAAAGPIDLAVNELWGGKIFLLHDGGTPGTSSIRSIDPVSGDAISENPGYGDASAIGISPASIAGHVAVARATDTLFTALNDDGTMPPAQGTVSRSGSLLLDRYREIFWLGGTASRLEAYSLDKVAGSWELRQYAAMSGNGVPLEIDDEGGVWAAVGTSTLIRYDSRLGEPRWTLDLSEYGSWSAGASATDPTLMPDRMLVALGGGPVVVVGYDGTVIASNVSASLGHLRTVSSGHSCGISMAGTGVSVISPSTAAVEWSLNHGYQIDKLEAGRRTEWEKATLVPTLSPYTPQPDPDTGDPGDITGEDGTGTTGSTPITGTEENPTLPDGVDPLDPTDPNDPESPTDGGIDGDKLGDTDASKSIYQGSYKGSARFGWKLGDPLFFNAQISDQYGPLGLLRRVRMYTHEGAHIGTLTLPYSCTVLPEGYTTHALYKGTGTYDLVYERWTWTADGPLLSRRATFNIYPATYSGASSLSVSYNGYVLWTTKSGTSTTSTTLYALPPTGGTLYRWSIATSYSSSRVMAGITGGVYVTSWTEDGNEMSAETILVGYNGNPSVRVPGQLLGFDGSGMPILRQHSPDNFDDETHFLGMTQTLDSVIWTADAKSLAGVDPTKNGEWRAMTADVGYGYDIAVAYDGSMYTGGYSSKTVVIDRKTGTSRSVDAFADSKSIATRGQFYHGTPTLQQSNVDPAAYPNLDGDGNDILRIPYKHLGTAWSGYIDVLGPAEEFVSGGNRIVRMSVI